MKAELENTYAEAFEGLLCRVIITAEDEKTLCGAAEDATATPSVVIGRGEGGIERWLSPEDTPDGREGALLQFWGGIDDNKPLQQSLARFESELSYRIRQDILVKPFTALFDALQHSIGRLDMMEKVGHCGDGFEWEETRYGRKMVIVPLMVPDFLIERYLGYAKGIMGANFWYLCETKEAVMNAGKRALEAIGEVEAAITPFGICSAGSKPQTKFPHIGPTTNHPYCPSLKEQLGDSSKVPEGVHYIPEIVINSISLEGAKSAMKTGIEAVRSVKGVKRVSAGNYGGRLGKYKIWLTEL